MKNIEVMPCELLTPITEMLINEMIDFGYGYDLQDEIVERIAQFCDENDIEYKIVEEEI